MEELEKKIMEFQFLRSGLEQLELKEREVTEAKLEIETALNSIKELKNLKSKKDALINFGAGTYVKGEIKPSNKILVRIGAGVVVEKGLEDAINIMEERLKNMENTLKRIRDEKEKVIISLELLKEDIENMQKKGKR